MIFFIHSGKSKRIIQKGGFFIMYVLMYVCCMYLEYYVRYNCANITTPLVT